MNEELEKILNKFDIVLRNYEFDKKFGQMSVDSICHLFPSEILIIKNYIKAYENMRKEAINLIEKETYFSSNDDVAFFDKILSLDDDKLDNLLNILNKVGEDND